MFLFQQNEAGMDYLTCGMIMVVMGFRTLTLS